MSESRKITLYHTDDWVWVYADDRLVLSQHSCTGEDLLRALGYENFESLWERVEIPAQEFWGIGDGPKSHSDFPKKMFK